MMTEDKRIEWLLELQDHPKQLTDEQMQQILADDEMRQLVQQLGFAKRAFKHDELVDDTPDVEGEWEKFAAKHAELLDALDEDKPKFPSSFFISKDSGILHRCAPGFGHCHCCHLEPHPRPFSKRRGERILSGCGHGEEGYYSPLHSERGWG